jgi:hypothetical protein
VLIPQRAAPTPHRSPNRGPYTAVPNTPNWLVSSNQGQCPVSVLDKDFSKAKQPNFSGMSKTPADNLSVQQNVSRNDIYYRHLGRTRGHSLSNKFVAGPTGHCRKSVNLIQFFFFLLQNSVYTKWKLGSRQTQKTSLQRWLLRWRHHVPFIQHTIISPFPGRLTRSDRS